MVFLPVERQTNDITLCVQVAFQSSTLAKGARLAAPSGLKYNVYHRAGDREVASGFTDQVGKSVIRRKGTLFVGEEYVVRTARAPGAPSTACGTTAPPVVMPPWGCSTSTRPRH